MIARKGGRDSVRSLKKRKLFELFSTDSEKDIYLIFLFNQCVEELLGSEIIKTNLHWSTIGDMPAMDK